jgi:hypothetical protein
MNVEFATSFISERIIWNVSKTSGLIAMNFSANQKPKAYFRHIHYNMHGF